MSLKKVEDKPRKLDENDVLEIFDSLKSKYGMDDGALSLWYNKRKSRNLSEIERNLNDAVTSRVNSVQQFLNIAFQLATFDARVRYELESIAHAIQMMHYAEREKFIEIARKEVENKMLEMELGLASLDYEMKRAILLKVNPHPEVEDKEDDDKYYDPLASGW